MTWTSIRIRIITTALCVAGLASAARAEVETWTSASGASIEAEYVGMRDGLVILEKKGGGELGIAPTKLDEASRLRVQQRQEAEAAARPPPQPHEVRFATHTVRYLEPSGRILVHILDAQGGSAGAPLEFMLFGSYTTPDGNQRDRKVTGLAEPAEWTNGELTLHLHMSDGVEAQLYCRTEAGTVHLGYRVEEPKDAVPIQSYRLYAYIRPLFTYDGLTETYRSRDYPQGLTQAEFDKVAADMTVTTDPHRGKTVTVTYAQTVTAFPGPSLSVEIRGVYAARTIRLEVPGKKCWVVASIYEGKTAADGYSLDYCKEDKESDADTPSELLTLTIK